MKLKDNGSSYGSYDCPEVWTLRRDRDYDLAEKWYGRKFIEIYHLVGPTIVSIFGQLKWFNTIWKKLFDKKVVNLKKKGFESTPYNDYKWR